MQAVHFNTFRPEFIKWTYLSLNLAMSDVANRDVDKNQNRMVNKVDSDQPALKVRIYTVCTGIWFDLHGSNNYGIRSWYIYVKCL